ncbi:hypothetical protein IC620_08160 [Hazenella sp. IB182357]|uniref:Uncharacterized protein n=1 Tax=Polycladospora coralii TaxID=2771432 RepID=A0A926RU03_9BACL|nr:hypothetical protein [Polycladospora coralii]MBD1372328.1 hypothetical protein [Polycladospora coralii]MBS7531482.1 hypothetical protein [Polycladospora coralii]
MIQYKKLILTFLLAFSLSTVSNIAYANDPITFPPPKDGETPISNVGEPTEEEFKKFQEEVKNELSKIENEFPLTEAEKNEAKKLDSIKEQLSREFEAKNIELSKDTRPVPNSYEDYINLDRKNDPLGDVEKVPQRIAGSAKWHYFGWGDIAFAKPGTSGNSFDYGTFRHTGMWDNDKKRLITAQPSPGVIWEYQTEWNDRYPEIFGSWIPSLTASERASATRYAVAQLGEPYSLRHAKTVSYRWYCSKLPWAGIHGHGVDIDRDGGFLVLPDDIYYDSDVSKFVNF